MSDMVRQVRTFEVLTATEEDQGSGQLECVLTQLEAVEAERDALIEPQKDSAPAPAAMLAQVKGIGPEIAALLWPEGLFRHFENQRQVAAYAGLAPTPWQSGSVDREQGVSKAGNPRIRTTMIQLAWLWLRNQPASLLSCWFRERVRLNGGQRLASSSRTTQ